VEKVRKAGILVLGLYAFILAIGSYLFTSQEAVQFTKSSSSHQFSLASSDLFSVNVTSEQTYTSLDQSSSKLAKVNFGDYLSAVKVIESSFAHLHTKYLAAIRDKVFKLQSHNIIFPFHFFW